MGIIGTDLCKTIRILVQGRYRPGRRMMLASADHTGHYLPGGQGKQQIHQPRKHKGPGGAPVSGKMELTCAHRQHWSVTKRKSSANGPRNAFDVVDLAQFDHVTEGRADGLALSEPLIPPFA